MLTKDARFYPAFMRHELYARMLADLDIVKRHHLNEDEDEDVEADDEINTESTSNTDLQDSQRTIVVSVF